jgi:hypothetical protein
MKDWPEFVKAYHVLIAKLILSDAYALFTHLEREDRIFLEGLALWAGHDYSSAKGQDIAYWAEEYRRLILRKGTTADVPTYHQWSNRIRIVLQGPRALMELAQIVVYSTKCMGKGKSLYVPQQLITKIEQRGGAARLKQCIEGNKAPHSCDFTRFLAKAILERQQTWPSQTAVEDGTAPKQLLEEWEDGKRLAKVSSPPPGRSPPTSPRPRKENRSQPKTQVQDQTGRKEGADYKAALEKGQEGAQAVDPGQTSMKKYLSPKKKPSAANEKRQREVAQVMEPVIDKIKKEIELGAQGYHVEDASVPVTGEETESDEERRLQRLKRKPSGAQGQGQGKESEKVLVPTLKRQRGRIAQDGRLLPKGTTATDAHGRMLEETEEMVQRRLEKAKRILDYIRQHPDHYPPVERHKNGRPVTLDENDAYAQGLKVTGACSRP